MAHRHRPDTRPAPAWTRRKMLALLIGASCAALLLVAGLALDVTTALNPAPRHAAAAQKGTESVTLTVPAPGSATATATATGSGSGSVKSLQTAAEDALAARPMPQVDQSLSEPGPVSTHDPGPPIVLPAATGTGPVGVPTGYPHTAAGAMAQMAAIDQAALQSGSLAGARSVITGWAQPGGPTASSWSGVAALAQFFDAAGLSGGGSAQLSLVATPLMGLVKGTVGPDFVIPCVDFEIDATLTTTARVAIADCERMTWTPDTDSPTALPSGSATGGRWMVGPGSEPATPPSVWPDTEIAITVGYHDLTTEPGHA